MRMFEDILAERMKDPDFKKEYDALEPEFAAIQAAIDKQKQLTETEAQLVCENEQF